MQLDRSRIRRLLSAPVASQDIQNIPTMKLSAQGHNDQHVGLSARLLGGMLPAEGRAQALRDEVASGLHMDKDASVELNRKRIARRYSPATGCK